MGEEGTHDNPVVLVAFSSYSLAFCSAATHSFCSATTHSFCSAATHSFCSVAIGVLQSTTMPLFTSSSSFFTSVPHTRLSTLLKDVEEGYL